MKQLLLVLALTLTTLGTSQSGSQIAVYDMNYFQTTVPKLVKAHNDLDAVVQIHRRALDNLVASQSAALKQIAELEARVARLEGQGQRLATLEARR
jgi:Skp family chaperone for outer membrane proteins